MTTPIRKTTIHAGKMESGKPFQVSDTSGRGRPVQTLTFTWNKEVLKGFSIRFWGQQAPVNGGDWNDTSLSRATIDFKEDDVLDDALLVTRGDYGKGSVGGVKIVSRDFPAGWLAGRSGFNTYLSVKDHALMGIYGAMNADNFINALGFLINDTGEDGE